jgi:hypothetical protein
VVGGAEMLLELEKSDHGFGRQTRTLQQHRFATIAASAKPADSAMSTEVAPGNSAYIYNSRNWMLLAIYMSDENAN